MQSAAKTAGGLALASVMANRSFGAETFTPRVAAFSKVYQELKLSFDDAAAVTAEAGLDGIDCPVREGGEITPQHAADEMPRYAEALRRRGVGMLLLTTGILGVSSPHARDILQTAKLLGIRYYRLGYWSHRPDRPADKLVEQARASLRELAAMNRELGVCGVYQNHSAPTNRERRNVGCDLAELYDLVKDFNPDQIGVAFDLGHAIIEHGDRWREHFERLRPHIRVVYVKDVRRPSRFVPFGQGEFGDTGFFRLLAKMNYRAPISMHIEYDWAGKGPKTRDLLVKTLKDNRQVLGRWLADV